MTCVACQTALRLGHPHRCINDGLEHRDCQCPCQHIPAPDPQQEMETASA